VNSVEKQEKVVFTLTDTNEKVEFYVVEQTRLGNINYILVTKTQEDEAEAYILKEISGDVTEALYDIVVEDVELEAVSKIFSEILEDIDLEL